MLYQGQLSFLIHAASPFLNDSPLFSSQVHFSLASGDIQIPNTGINAYSHTYSIFSVEGIIPGTQKWELI